MYEHLPLPQEESGAYGDWKKKTALFLSSQGLSLFGSMLVQYAIIWYITLTTGSGVMLTISTVLISCRRSPSRSLPGCGPIATRARP